MGYSKVIILILCTVFLNSCVIRTNKTYIKTPPNSQGTLIEEKSELIWCWEEKFSKKFRK